MSLSIDQARWVAHLARLQLSEDELTSIARDLSAIVEYVNQLQSVNTDGVQPLVHSVELANVFRADESTPSLPLMES